MKQGTVILLFLLLSGRAVGQVDPRIILNEGEVTSTTVARINGRHFGFKIEWGQKDTDTIRYEFIHGKKTSRLDVSKGYLVGKQSQFSMHDISRVVPGNKLLFKLELNGNKCYLMYDVLSTTASESKPWFFDVSFILNGDTLNTTDYQVYYSYPLDSIRKWERLKSTPVKPQRDQQAKVIRYYFNHHTDLPPYLRVAYKQQVLSYDFVRPDFYHGHFFLTYLETKKKSGKRQVDFNSTLEFYDMDAGTTFTHSSNQY